MTLTARRAFTLIELLIVVAIIAILAAIAVPNFLEAQTRSKVSRVKSDLRTTAIGLESFRVDFNDYPEGTDQPARYPERMEAFFQPLGLAAGYYALRTRGGNEIAGQHFQTLTTPIAYLTNMPTDPFAGDAARFLTYAYRNAKATRNGWILTSVGPDSDLLESKNGKLGAGTTNPNPLSTWSDGNSPARLGDVNERAVIHYIEGTSPAVISAVQSQYGSLPVALADLSYDPTNGTLSDGDIIYLSGFGLIGAN